MSFFLGMLVMWLIHPLLTRFFRYVRLLWVLRQAMKPFRIESRRAAMNRVGEWRDD